MTNQLQNLEDLAKVVEDIKGVNDKKFAEIKKHGEDSANELKEQVSKGISEWESKLLSYEKSYLRNIENNSNPEEKKSLEFFNNIRRKELHANNDLNLEDFNEYKSNLNKYLKLGMRAISTSEYKILQTADDTQGGYFVVPQISDEIIKKAFDDRGILNLVDRSIVTDVYKYIIDWHDYDEAYFSHELTGESVPTALDQFKEKTIYAKEVLYGKRFSRTMLEDAYIDIESYVLGQLREGIVRKVADLIINGISVDEPRGILTYPDGTTFGTIEQITSTTSGVIAWEDMLKLLRELKDKYHNNATFVMRRQAFFAMCEQTSTAGGLYVNVFEREKLPLTIAGYPVKFDAGLPIVSAGNLSVALGDFKAAYKLSQKGGMGIIRDDITDAKVVKTTLRARFGGDVANFEAVKLLKIKS